MLSVYFNSIKVQLELSAAGSTLGATYKFQFHKGTIRTWSGTVNDDKLLIFQFHKGTIRTGGAPFRLSKCTAYFNSIKVQLERTYTILLNRYFIYFNSIKVQLERTLCRQFNQFIVFQFHKGTIRTR